MYLVPQVPQKYRLGPSRFFGRHLVLQVPKPDKFHPKADFDHCRIWISGKTLKVQTLGCAQSSFPPTYLRPSSLRSRGRTRNTERHGIYTGSGHHRGLIPYSSVWWWIASWADEEQYKGKNNLLRLRCSCTLWTCG